jgi:hypothetical protein
VIIRALLRQRADRRGRRLYLQASSFSQRRVDPPRRPAGQRAVRILRRQGLERRQPQRRRGQAPTGTRSDRSGAVAMYCLADRLLGQRRLVHQRLGGAGSLRLHGRQRRRRG